MKYNVVIRNIYKKFQFEFWFSTFYLNLNKKKINKNSQKINKQIEKIHRKSLFYN